MNCTVADNSATRDGGGVFCSYSAADLTNCILWGDEPNEFVAGFSTTPTLAYCDVEGGHEGVGNIDADPDFRSARGYDYILWPGSPGIDAATGGDDGVDWTSIRSRYGRHNTAAPDLGASGGPDNVGGLP